MFLRILFLPSYLRKCILTPNALSFFRLKLSQNQPGILYSYFLSDLIDCFKMSYSVDFLLSDFRLPLNVCNLGQLRYSSRSSQSRKIKVFINTDETLRKWNDFFVSLNEQSDQNSVPREDDNELISSAVTFWRNGHILKSYTMLTAIYFTLNVELKEDLVRAIQCLICFTFSTKGRALRNEVIEGAKTFSTETGETLVLATAWYSLFISGWHEDRVTADDLLSENVDLQKCVDKIFPLIGYYFLKSEDLTGYQSLIEISLQFNFKSSGLLLRALFDYYYRIGYLKGCDVVYKCCTDLGLQLTPSQKTKYEVVITSGKKVKLKSIPFSVTKDVKYKF